MCGICGILSYGEQKVTEEYVLKMRDTMFHRGPDDAGIYISTEGKIGLGSRRLSIIDLSPNGRMPMPNEDRSIWIVYNGEIYNFKELRRELEAKNHVFCSNTDTEVVLHLYEEEGIDCVKLLNGQFAFAIWNETENLLFLARDRLGIKPLYYYFDGKRFLFASELKAIVKDPTVPRKIDLGALNAYLTYQYVPSPQTIFRGIRKLPPGFTLTLKDGRINLKEYWRISISPNILHSENEYAEKLIILLRNSIKKRLVSDVPLGVFLSGGPDSSAIAALMTAVSGEPINTFSVGFEEGEFNESIFAEFLARSLKSNHHTFVIRPELARDLIPKLAYQFDEPLGDQALLPTYYMAREAKKFVTVCLSGEGGDECFGGYDRYDLGISRNRLVKIVNFYSHFITGTDINSKIQSALSPKADEYVKTLCSFPKEEKDQVLSEAVKEELKNDGSAYYHLERYLSTKLDFLTRLQYLDIKTYLPDNLLVKVDKASMLASLEVRVPFLDHHLIEFALNIPWNLRVKGGIKKWIFRKAMSGIVPYANLWRSKMGFSMPLKYWFRKDLDKYAWEVLLDKKIKQSGLFSMPYLTGLLQKNWSCDSAHGLKIWTLLFFAQWYHCYL